MLLIFGVLQMPTINQLSQVSQVSGSDIFPLYSSTNGNAVSASMATLASYMQGTISNFDDKITTYYSPLTAATIAMNTTGASEFMIITPAGTISALTLNMPVSSQRVDKQELLFFSTRIITALSINTFGASLNSGTISPIAANGFFTLRYCGVVSAWFRVC